MVNVHVAARTLHTAAASKKHSQIHQSHFPIRIRTTVQSIRTQLSIYYLVAVVAVLPGTAPLLGQNVTMRMSNHHYKSARVCNHVSYILFGW